MSETNPQPKPVEVVAEQPAQPAVATQQPVEQPTLSEVDAIQLKPVEAISPALKVNEELVIDGAEKVVAFRNTIEAISTMADDVYLLPNGTITAMDASHICLGSWNLSGMFSENTLTRKVALPIRKDVEKNGKYVEDKTAKTLLNLLRPLKQKNVPNSLKMSVEETNLLITLGSKQTRLPLGDVDEESVPPTSELYVEYDIEASFDPRDLIHAIDVAQKIADCMEIRFTDGTAKFGAEISNGGWEQFYSASTPIDTKGKTARGIYSISFLKNIFVMAKSASAVKMKIADNAPLSFEFEIQATKKGRHGLPCPVGYAKYYQAPRVEEGTPYELD